ncbi:hypothetical protein TNCV_4860851 [Trichonephila clavipes]|nr:hypothetical protein TNCV_4860851 [Trichonephila clavipes]
MMEEHVFHHDVRSGLIGKRSDMIYRPKDRAEERKKQHEPTSVNQISSGIVSLMIMKRSDCPLSLRLVGQAIVLEAHKKVEK